jgi:hypothetical protein
VWRCGSVVSSVINVLLCGVCCVVWRKLVASVACGILKDECVMYECVVKCVVCSV